MERIFFMKWNKNNEVVKYILENHDIKNPLIVTVYFIFRYFSQFVLSKYSDIYKKYKKTRVF